MKKIFTINQFGSRKKSVHFLDKKILSFPALKKSFSKKIPTPKFGVSYSVFDGEELLEASIKSIRNEVDYVNVVYQTKSWHGADCLDSLLPTLLELKEKKLIDELVFFEPDLKKKPGKNEAKKRNVGLQAAVRAGVNYFMPMDVDEFYFEKELAEAKKKIITKNITHSYCAQIGYANKPTLRKISNSSCYVQFFSKVDKFSILGANEFAPCLVDPTRMMLERKDSKHFVLNEVFMHHMSLVRKDFEKKRRNSSGVIDYDENSFTAKELVEVENYFGINF